MSFVRVADASEVEVGRITTVFTRMGRVGLTRIGERIVAFEDVCSHDGGSLDGGSLEGEEVACPRHGARFNVCTGKVLSMPATEDIEVFEVRLNGDDVEIDFG